MAVFRARYRGTCAKCHEALNPGDLASWSRRARGVIYHASCVAPGAPDITPAPAPEPDSPEPGLGHVALRLRKEVADLAAFVETAVQQGKAETIAACEARIKALVPLTVSVTLPDREEPTRIDGAHESMPDLLFVLGERLHAYLHGPPGSGKSKAAAMAAEALGLAFGYCSLNPQTPESRLLGYMHANGGYVHTVFRDLFENGGVMCIDEMDNGHPALLNTLNGMVEPGARFGAFPDGMVERHADFVLVCTGNTSGRGGDKLFPERRQFDAAFAERFVFIPWGYDLALERRLTLAQGSDAQASEAWLAWVRAVRAYCFQHSVRLWATPRAAMYGARFLGRSGWPVRKIADTVLFKGLDVDTVRALLAACPLPDCTARGEDE